MRVCHSDDPLVISSLPYEDLADSIRRSRESELLETIERQVRRLRTQQPGWLSIEDLESVARPNRDGLYRRVELDEGCRLIVSQAREEVERYLSRDPARARRIYGINTGFGSNRKYDLDAEDLSKVSGNMLHSHATGIGRPLPVDTVRAMMVSRIRTFVQGHSGVRWVILESLRKMLNRGLVPCIPSKGSVGCSGDLAPLAHLFLVMMGAGKAWLIQPGEWRLNESWNDPIDQRERKLRSGDRKGHWKGNPHILLTGREALELADIPPVELQAKEGLAVTNGASFSSSALALGVFDAERLFHSANVSGSLTHQAVSGHTRAFEAVVGAVRPHAGQILTGWELVRLLRGSTLVNRCSFIEEAQDDYSIRSMPAVHGAAWDAIAQARRIAEIELNSCTDNPLFFGRFQRGSFVGGGPGEGGDEGGGKLFEIGIEDLPSALTRKTLDTTHCSAANFHGEPVAIALDLLKIGVSELASIAERRIQLLLDANHNRGLPANLTLGAQGLHSGFQLMQYTAAALVAENRVLCHPSSVDSIPTSANAEDHVSMSANAARHAGEVLQNVTHVLAIETICALQALDIRTRFMGPLVRQRIRLRERRRGQGTGGQRTASIDDMRKVGWYIKREYGQIAMILFPEWARWRASQKHPVLEGEIKPGYEIQESDIPRRGYDWLNTEELTLTGPTRAVWELLRDESGYAIPVIHHDGVLGEKEKIWGLNDTVARSFQEFPPSDLIERTARAIISGDLKNAAWSALPAD